MSNQPIISPVKSSFHGGIHPPEFKTLSNQAAIQSITMAKELVIPLQQNIGKPSIPIINPGDKVILGQLLATSSPGLGANIHSPANGTIHAIEARHTGHPSGLNQPAIVLYPDENQHSHSNQVAQSEATNSLLMTDWQSQSIEVLVKRVADAGIVGLGGATFPTQVKLSAQPIETLIVNAMECEPYITCDDRMLQELSEQVIIGAQITAKIVQAKEIIFASEDNKPEAVSSLKKAIGQSTFKIPMKIVIAPTKYPSGGEKQTIEIVLGKQLPKGQLPAAIGVLVQNVATLQAIYNAVINAKPLVSRLVTITGNLVNKPGNYWLPFGTKLEHLIEYFGIDKAQCQTVILGGPLMGQRVTNLTTPVTKSCNCIIFNSNESNQKLWNTQSSTHQPCIRCGDCEKVCPVDLLPQQLFWFSQSEQWEDNEKQGLFDCIECGACAYVCPSEIPLVQYYRFAKSSIQNNRVKQQKSEIAKARFEFREMRLQRAKNERALKHKKAAELRRQAAENKQQDPSGKQTAINQALERVKQKKSEVESQQPNQDETPS